MFRAVLSSFVLIGCLSVAGCGGQSDEIAPLTEGGTDPSPEQQRNWAEESASHGGYQVPEQGGN